MTLAKTWQIFIKTGILADHRVRPVVAESWLRCRHRGIDPLSVPDSVHLSAKQLTDRLGCKEKLIATARPYMEALFSVIQGSGYLIGLADEKGYLLEVYGDQMIMNLVRGLDIVPGANWSEEIKGNSAIGTSLATGSPVQFTGTEHYLKFFHNLTCSGAPIGDPDGLTLGLLLVAGLSGVMHPHTLGMVMAAAKAIEHLLILDRQNRALRSVNHQIIDCSPDAIITVNESGDIVSFNKSAEKLSGISCLSALGKNAEMIFSCGGTANGSLAKILKSTQVTGRPLKNFQRTFKLPNGNNRLCIVNTYPLNGPENDVTGVLAVIRGLQNRKPAGRYARQPGPPVDSLSIIDNLTNLYNHKFFHERLEEEVHRSYLQKTKVSLVMLDIDYFKHYNDVLGYPAGDKLLAEFANILRSQVRGKDIVARYGGEEFTIILTDADTKLAVDIAERIRNAIENHPFEGREVQPKGKITVSIGVATYPSNATGKEELLKVAEEALYRAKNNSKSKIALYYSVFDDLKNELDQSDLSLLNTIKTLITVINAKDRYTFGHSERVVRYSTALGEQLGLGSEQIKYIKYGAYLHDIGKIEIGREILNKKEPLTGEEWAILQSHPQWGADMVKPVTALQQILPQILYHHERFDGRGYPSGIKGQDIPLNARILTIADSFDAMTTFRPYQKRRSLKDAVREIRVCAGAQFDPQLSEAFVKALENIQFEDEELVS